MKRALLLTLLMLACVAPRTTPAAQPSSTQSSAQMQRGETRKSFDDVLLEADFAITEHNFRITGRNTIGKGLRERGYTDFPDVEVIHFCNLEYAREVLLLDPDFVAQMPCRMTIHRQGDHTVVHLPLLPENHPDARVNAFAHRINGELREIFAFVMAQD